jgi:hypothetical protein
VAFEGQTVANASGDYDLFEVSPADDRPVALVALTLVVTSELAEAQEEWLRIAIIRGHSTGGNGSATTARPVNPTGAASGFAAETLATTPASAGTGVTLLADGFNVRNGYSFGPLPLNFGFGCSQAQTTIVVRLMAAVVDDVTMSGTLWVAEW